MGKLWQLLIQFLKNYGKDLALFLLKRWLEGETNPDKIVDEYNDKNGQPQRLTVSKRAIKNRA